MPCYACSRLQDINEDIRHGLQIGKDQKGDNQRDDDDDE